MVIVKSFGQILAVLDCVDKITGDDKVYLYFCWFYFLHPDLTVASPRPPSWLKPAVPRERSILRLSGEIIA